MYKKLPFQIQRAQAESLSKPLMSTENLTIASRKTVDTYDGDGDIERGNQRKISEVSTTRSKGRQSYVCLLL